MIDERITPGAVIQVNDENPYYHGCLCIVEQVGSVGVIANMVTPERQRKTYLEWEEIKFIGMADFVPRKEKK